MELLEIEANVIEDEVLIHVEGKQARTGRQKSFKRKYTNARALWATASTGPRHRQVDSEAVNRIQCLRNEK